MSVQPSTVNPFSKVYSCVYSLLFGGDGNPLAAFVKQGNRPDLTQNVDNPFKQSTVGADMPEIILVDEGGNWNPHLNSSQTEWVMYLSVYCSSGDWRSMFITTLNWYIVVNMKQWVTTLQALTWKDLTFVKNVASVQVQIGESNSERPKIPQGWVSIWRFQIRLVIPQENVTYTES